MIPTVQIRIRNAHKTGFSLTEVLVAMGIMTVGMMLVLTLFPLGVQLTIKSVQDNMASIVAEEAFAKVRLHIDDASAFMGDSSLKTDETASYYHFDTSGDIKSLNGVDIEEWDTYYPSTVLRAAADADQPKESKYSWSALVRPVNKAAGIFQVTVLVFHRSAFQAIFYDGSGTAVNKGTSAKLQPLKVKIDYATAVHQDDWLKLDGEYWLIAENSPVIDDKTGRLYSIEERRINGNTVEFRIDRDWQELYGIASDSTTNSVPDYVWIVPPAANASGTNCIGVFQRIMSLN